MPGEQRTTTPRSARGKRPTSRGSRPKSSAGPKRQQSRQQSRGGSDEGKAKPKRGSPAGKGVVLQDSPRDLLGRRKRTNSFTMPEGVVDVPKVPDVPVEQVAKLLRAEGNRTGIAQILEELVLGPVMEQVQDLYTTNVVIPRAVGEAYKHTLDTISFALMDPLPCEEAGDPSASWALESGADWADEDCAACEIDRWAPGRMLVVEPAKVDTQLQDRKALAAQSLTSLREIARQSAAEKLAAGAGPAESEHSEPEPEPEPAPPRLPQSPNTPRGRRPRADWGSMASLRSEDGGAMSMSHESLLQRRATTASLKRAQAADAGLAEKPETPSGAEASASVRQKQSQPPQSQPETRQTQRQPVPALGGRKQPDSSYGGGGVPDAILLPAQAKNRQQAPQNAGRRVPKAAAKARAEPPYGGRSRRAAEPAPVEAFDDEGNVIAVRFNNAGGATGQGKNLPALSPHKVPGLKVSVNANPGAGSKPAPEKSGRSRGSYSAGATGGRAGSAGAAMDSARRRAKSALATPGVGSGTGGPGGTRNGARGGQDSSNLRSTHSLDALKRMRKDMRREQRLQEEWKDLEGNVLEGPPKDNNGKPTVSWAAKSQTNLNGSKTATVNLPRL